ncbi:hypothetical protein B0T25DRAFT_111871 [Lasiosphaeria hispida]|uniref:Uncharacterized protein n=1 Tax=Lasiosphaeria hispida TaxID=260671 RepID=A0AAJ0MI14_9PEZI|nr:hypothetical protein B0T25DRAFT_111871 [Lasiosphaeria hispida]
MGWQVVIFMATQQNQIIPMSTPQKPLPPIPKRRAYFHHTSPNPNSPNSRPSSNRIYECHDHETDNTLEHPTPHPVITTHYPQEKVPRRACVRHEALLLLSISFPVCKPGSLFSRGGHLPLLARRLFGRFSSSSNLSVECSYMAIPPSDFVVTHTGRNKAKKRLFAIILQSSALCLLSLIKSGSCSRPSCDSSTCCSRWLGERARYRRRWRRYWTTGCCSFSGGTTVRRPPSDAWCVDAWTASMCRYPRVAAVTRTP